jgi:uncharacterized protein GlcG (DUF336 family)
MLKLVEANRAVEAALAKAEDLAINISVSVCDAYGHLVSHQRMDHAFAEACHMSMGKAIAAAWLGLPSGEQSERNVEACLVDRVVARGAPIIRIRGGLPIIRGGEVEGGVGVCGGHAHEQDEECALAGIQALVERGRHERV